MADKGGQLPRYIPCHIFAPSDEWVWQVLEHAPSQRREAARDMGRTLSECIVRARALLDDPAAWERCPVQMRRYADSLERRRSQPRVVRHGR